MAKQHSIEVSATVHCTEVACIFALLAFYHMAQGSHKKNYETLDIVLKGRGVSSAAKLFIEIKFGHVINSFFVLN